MSLPTALGKYELVEPLATGGMAELFLARARGPAGVQKTVVVKRIKPEYADDPRFVHMFIHEARVGVHLTHPNIVQIFELGRSAGTWFIAMEYVFGRDLTRLVRRARADASLAMPEEVAVHVVAELLRGLHHAHSRTDADGKAVGLVHQDVSPHNTLLGFDGEVKLLDFGIARTASQADAGTQAGRGKFAYASPEAATGGPVDHRTDIYSAGVVLWELIANQRPFTGGDAASKIDRIRSEGLVPLATARPGVDPALSAIVARATHRNADERHPSAALFEEDLRAWLYESGHRVGAAEVSAWARSLFPDARRPEIGLPVRALAADLERLDTDVAPTPSPRALPGRLQQSPGERKQVAVLVVDVDGLTELSARLDPEPYFSRHFRMLRWMHRIVGHWGGVVQRAIDDHLFILFGVPRTRDDDLSRAMDCALELMARKAELEPSGLSLELSMGLHAGEVTVAVARRRVHYVARGNTTRLARRLSAAADHGQILVSERVLTSMVADFRLRQGPVVPARGGKAGLSSYELEGRRPGRLTRRGAWLRRGEEIEQLRRAVERLASGQGAALALIGPLGSGKSRLVREVQVLAQRRDIPFHLVRCDAWGPGQAFREIVEAVLGIGRNAPPERVREQLEAAAQLGLTARQLAMLHWMVGGRIDGVPDRSEIALLLETLVRGLAEGGGAILALEAEGMDPGDLELIAELAQRTSHDPLLHLIVWRTSLPEPLASVCEEVRLGPFDREAQGRMLTSLLEVESVDPALAELVARTCEGNALYLEEMVKYLLERGQVVVDGARAVLADPDVALPDSLHGLISARIDALDAASKGILQLAAVIGPAFTGPLLARAAGLDDPSPLLMELDAHGLVARTEDGWSFATELVREAALRGILGARRRDYHRLVADAIEALHADQPERWSEALAGHCAAGGRPVDAARYGQLAGIALEGVGRLSEARDRYEQGLRWLASASDPDVYDARIQGEASLNLKAGAVSLLLGDTDRGVRSLNLALDIASDAGLPWIEARAHLELGRSYLERGRTRLASAHLGQARAMLPLDDEPELELQILEASAMLAWESGKGEEAEGLWQAVLERASGEARVQARCWIGLANRWIRAGEHDRAQTALRTALKATRLAQDRILEGRVLNNIGLLYSWSNRHDDALFYYRRALEVREGIGYTRGVVINHHNVGDVHFQKGHWSRAHVAFARSRDLAERIGWDRGVALNDVYLAYIAAVRGEGDLTALTAAKDRASACGDPEIATTGSWLLGRFMAESGQHAAARDQLGSALEDARRWGLVPMVKVIEAALG